MTPQRIKPRNIFLGPGNEIWLSNFGFAVRVGAKHLRTTSYDGRKVQGAPEYLAPEQANSTPLPCRSATSTLWL